MKRFISLLLVTSAGLLATPEVVAAESVSASTQSVVRVYNSSKDAIALGNSINGTALGRSRTVLETAFVFDLSSITLPFNSATFSLDIRGYQGINPLGQTIALSDAVTAPSVFEKNGIVSTGPFRDLQDGDMYGSRLILLSDNLTRVTFTLTGAALDDMRTAQLTPMQKFVIGAALQNLSSSGSDYFIVANASIQTSFVTPVPEAVTAAFGTGLVCVALGSRRRQPAR